MGEPSIVLAIYSPGSNPFEKPKSPSFTFPLLKNIFYGLISLCIILNLLSTLKASRSYLNIFKAFFYGKLPSFLISYSNVPSLQY